MGRLDLTPFQITMRKLDHQGYDHNRTKFFNMGDAGFFKASFDCGTSLEQDSRFSDKEKKLLKSMNFPPEYNKKSSQHSFEQNHPLALPQIVDLKKVNMTVIKPWIAQKVVDILGGEDEVVINYVFGLLEEPDPDPRMMQINLTGFLEKNAQTFVTELWKLLLSAQDGVGGIPTVFLEQKMEEIRRKKEQDERIMAEIRKKRDKEEEEKAKLRDIRDRERKEERERREREYKTHRRSRSRDEETRFRRGSRRSRSRSKSEEGRHRRHSFRRSRSRERNLDRSRDHRRNKSYRHGSRSRSKDQRRHEEKRHRHKSRSRSRNREDLHHNRRRISKNEYVSKHISTSPNPISPERNQRDIQNVSNKRMMIDSPEVITSPRESPPRKKVPDAPIFKSKWNDDEDDEEVEEITKKSTSEQEQLEQRLRAKLWWGVANKNSKDNLGNLPRQELSSYLPALLIFADDI
ncbi:hypothetical protein G9A89_023511 [Geosiphon pyriformis]|nr:hypothetical protein G9A89_023511 [Geosiphon pyriformis]